MTPLADAIAAAAERLAAAGVPSPRADAELLAGHVLVLGRGEVQARALAGAVLDDADATAFWDLVARRAAREPLQHLTGVAHFRGLTLGVGPGVFVPRPETEVVAQFAIDALRSIPVAGRPSTRSARSGNGIGAHSGGGIGARSGPGSREAVGPIAVDLGTGSGAIAIALATEVPHARVLAVEVSPDAFVWAKQNARAAATDNLTLVLGDLAHALPELDGLVDVVVSNPPYIPTGAVPRDPEVRLHDPELALYGGEDGLDLVRALDATARRLLRAGGSLVIEHGELQGDSIARLLRASGWRAVATHPDLTGRPRATTAIR